MEKTLEIRGSKSTAKLFLREGGETLIHFNFKAIPLAKEEFFPLAGEIFDQSGGRITLYAELAEYGILVLRENLAIEEGLAGWNREESLDALIEKLESSAIY